MKFRTGLLAVVLTAGSLSAAEVVAYLSEGTQYDLMSTDRPIARTTSDSLFVFYGTGTTICVAGKHASDQEWSPPETLFVGNRPAVTVGRDNTVYIAYTGGPDDDMWWARRAVGGAWSEPLDVGFGNYSHKATIDVDSSGYLHLTEFATDWWVPYQCLTPEGTSMGWAPDLRTYFADVHEVLDYVPATNLGFATNNVYLAVAYTTTEGEARGALLRSGDHALSWELVYDWDYRRYVGGRSAVKLGVGATGYPGMDVPVLLIPQGDTLEAHIIRDYAQMQGPWPMDVETVTVWVGDITHFSVDNPKLIIGFESSFLVRTRDGNLYHRFVRSEHEPDVQQHYTEISTNDTVPGTGSAVGLTYKTYNADFIDVVWYAVDSIMGPVLMYERMAKGIKTVVHDVTAPVTPPARATSESAARKVYDLRGRIVGDWLRGSPTAVSIRQQGIGKAAIAVRLESGPHHKAPH